MDNNLLTVVVSSPRSYKDVFDIFYSLYTKYWNDSIYPFVLSTNYDALYNGIQVINSNKPNDTWVERVSDLLDKIHTKYILILCDDLFFIDRVYNQDIAHVVSIMEENSLDFCRLKPIKKGNKIANSSFLVYPSKQTPYAMNLQRGIFRVNYLKELLSTNIGLSAWELESKWLANNSHGFYTNIISVTKNVLPIIHGIEKGKYYPSALYKIKKMGLGFNTNRPVMSNYEEFKYKLMEYYCYHLPPFLRRTVKKILTLGGVKFISPN